MICLYLRQAFLIAVDYYSGYFELQDLSNTASNRVITVLKSWFARHGIPVTVISDNGPPFNSGDLSRSVKNGTFIRLLQALATRRVMVVLKMP